MATFEELIEAGWREYPVNTHIDRHDRNCQITVRRKNKKLYFINANEYDFTNYTKVPIGKQLSCKVEFYLGENTWFTVALHDCHHKTVEQIMSFFSGVYRGLRCVPDIHNN